MLIGTASTARTQHRDRSLGYFAQSSTGTRSVLNTILDNVLCSRYFAISEEAEAGTTNKYRHSSVRPVVGRVPTSVQARCNDSGASDLFDTKVTGFGMSGV